MLIFNISPSFAFASQTDSKSSEAMSNLSKAEQQDITNHLETLKSESADNSNELSKENKQIVAKTLEDFEGNLNYADINDGQKVAILDTDKKDTLVAVTDGIVEVVEKVSENDGEYDFLINGEKHHFEFTISDSPEDGQTSMKNWDFQSSKWVNINAERNFSTYTAGALGSILGTFLGGVLSGGWSVLISGLAVGAAYNYVASSAYPTNVGNSHVYLYTSGPEPLVDRRAVSNDYAVYQGQNVFLGTAEEIKLGCVGCGV